MRLDVRDVSWGVEHARILVDVALSCAPGTFVGLVGPNGSGKSSLLRCIYRTVRPDAGNASVDGRDVWTMTPRELARDVAVVLQERPSETAFSVREVVLMGRGTQKRFLEQETTEDHKAVDDLLGRMKLSGLAERAFDSLSGGERQRALIARALAQEPKLLVLDEPTTHLDIGHQFEMLELVRNLGVTTIAALHDLNHAAAYCDHVVMLHGGSVRASGSPSEVLTPALIEAVYGVRAVLSTHPLTDRLHVFVAGSSQ